MRVSDRFVVTMFMGITANAVYAVANKIPSILTLAHGTFNMAWLENASIVVNDKDVNEYYSSMFRTILDLVAGLLGLLICAAPLLFQLLIRGDYSEAYAQLPILFLAMFFNCVCSFLGGIYIAHKATLSVGITSTAAATCNLLVDLALIKKIGLYAASGSTLISYLFLMIFRMIDVKKLVAIRYDFKHILLVVGILLIETALCFINRLFSNIFNILFGVTTFFMLNRSFVKVILEKAKQVFCKITS